LHRPGYTLLDPKKMNNLPDNVSPQELFESSGNDPALWASRAEALLTSAHVLDAQYAEVPKDDLDLFWKFFKLHTVAMMLKGMAIECLLKSIWIAHVSSLVVNGKFHSISGTRDHDLLSLVTAIGNHVDLSLLEEEMELLAVLSFAITSGRYPVEKGFNARPTAPDWIELGCPRFLVHSECEG